MKWLAVIAVAALTAGCHRGEAQGGSELNYTNYDQTYKGTGRSLPGHGDVGGNGRAYDRGGPPTPVLQQHQEKQENQPETNPPPRRAEGKSTEPIPGSPSR